MKVMAFTDCEGNDIAVAIKDIGTEKLIKYILNNINLDETYTFSGEIKNFYDESED